MSLSDSHHYLNRKSFSLSNRKSSFPNPSNYSRPLIQVTLPALSSPRASQSFPQELCPPTLQSPGSYQRKPGSNRFLWVVKSIFPHHRQRPSRQVLSNDTTGTKRQLLSWGCICHQCYVMTQMEILWIMVSTILSKIEGWWPHQCTWQQKLKLRVTVLWSVLAVRSEQVRRYQGTQICIGNLD